MNLRMLFVCLALLASGGSFASENADTPDSVAAALKKLPGAAQNILQYALSQTGVNYKRGGTTPESGFDCSGFVRHVFDQVVGLTLPHSSHAMSLIGKKIMPAELRPGDLVFFRAVRNTVSHVGIYLGNNQFIHASSTQTGSVMVSDLRDSYWVKHFSAARRLDIPSPE